MIKIYPTLQKIVLIAGLFSGMNLYAQTDSIESEMLMNKLTTKQITYTEYSRQGQRWNKIIKSINGYPDLPFDSHGEVTYRVKKDFPTCKKEWLYNRTAEWLAINFGMLPANLYMNQTDGKIIGMNSLGTGDQTFGTFSFAFTVRDEIILIEYLHISLNETMRGYYDTNNLWIQESTHTFPVEQVFPVVMQKESEWDSLLKQLKAFDEGIKGQIDSLYAYISTYYSKYPFN